MVSAADGYRDFTLRDSTANVIAKSQSATRDLRTLHERPHLVQELAWRPSFLGHNAPERDAVSGIIFSFLDDQLFRMSVTYDPSRTEGLTRQDLIDSLSTIYGPRSTLPAQGRSNAIFDSVDTASPIAVWRSGDTVVTLNEMTYRGGFGLVITSTALAATAKTAQAAAETLDAREAPAREAARAKVAAEAARAAADKTRSTNKGAFKP